MALLLGVWNADSLYEGNVEDMFYNVMLAYYLCCSNVAMLTKEFGSSRWEQYFLPMVTFSNAMAVVGQFVGRCLYWPSGIGFMPDKTRERICELFFAWVKSRSKGMPRQKDMIYGTWYIEWKIQSHSIIFNPRSPIQLQALQSSPIHTAPNQATPFKGPCNSNPGGP